MNISVKFVEVSNVVVVNPLAGDQTSLVTNQLETFVPAVLKNQEKRNHVVVFQIGQSSKIAHIDEGGKYMSGRVNWKEGIFQTRKEVEQYFSGEFITCLICGEEKKALAKHLSVKHPDVSVTDYKIMFGLPHSSGLVASMTKEKQADALLHRIALGDKSIIVDATKLPKYFDRPKNKPVHYSRNERAHAPTIKMINEKSHEESLKNINAIDWANVLEMMKILKLTSHSLSKLPNMPSQNMFFKKRQIDPSFNEKYFELTKNLKKVEKICPICKKVFWVKLSKNEERRTCSRKCAAKDFSLRGISYGRNAANRRKNNGN